jgi:2-polyprenyl-3-methyl-5-hydroxy-6-metoxy-1,4-benzoquinol methylase
MKLTSKQQEQEDDYNVGPYHWFKERSTQSGRLYFGYLDICLNFIKGKNLNEKNVLDAGCGDGRFVGLLKDAGVNNVYGIDFSERAISFARLMNPTANLSVADLKDFPFGKDFFDYIFFIETLEHIIPANINSVLEGLAGSLKNGGELIVTVPSVRYGIPGPDSKHYQHFTPESLREALTPYFTVIEMVGQDKEGFHLLKLIYKFIDNHYFVIKPLKVFYNLKIWPKYFNLCSFEQGKRLIVRCKKNDTHS